jgi:hypothetical protein
VRYSEHYHAHALFVSSDTLGEWRLRQNDHFLKIVTENYTLAYNTRHTWLLLSTHWLNTSEHNCELHTLRQIRHTWALVADTPTNFIVVAVVCTVSYNVRRILHVTPPLNLSPRWSVVIICTLPGGRLFIAFILLGAVGINLSVCPPRTLFLGDYSKLRKMAFGFLMLAGLSVRREKVGSHWMYCHKIQYFRFF